MGNIRKLCCVVFAWALLSCERVDALDVHVAVAANFAPTLELIAPEFQKATGHRVVPSSASSGQLYAQIDAGAPFDVFLSADVARPERVVKAGLGVSGTEFVYARGRLVLWSPERDLLKDGGRVLSRDDLGVVAVPDPRLAPYGAAGASVLRALGLWDELEEEGRLAIASSVTQAYQFVASGTARLGFVALSQVIDRSSGRPRGSYWMPPSSRTLDQEAVLLARGRHNAGATAFLTFLRSNPRARALIASNGYFAPGHL